MLEIKGQVFHRLHLKVSVWLSDLNALQTRKLPTFWSRLNEISGGRGNMCEVFENDICGWKVLWMVGEGEWNSVGFFVL